jgi:hypothetical protein
MGWQNRHLWEVRANERRYSLLISDDPDWNERINNAAPTLLSDLLRPDQTEINYLYDMGDNWLHRIVVEKVGPARAGVVYPELLGGERRCPPEDCGGHPGYNDFLAKLASKTKKRAALNWYGGPYDPNDMDEEAVIIKLTKIAND